MFRKVWIIASLIVPFGAMAAPNSQLAQLRQQVAALQIYHALNLTQQQAQSLLPLLQNAQSQIQAFKAERVAAEPALTAALTQAVTDLQTTGSISATTAQAVNAARPSFASLRAELKSTWQQARQILTQEQIQALKAVQLGVPPPTSTTPAQPRRAGFAHRFRVMHAVLSNAFISLVQAQAG